MYFNYDKYSLRFIVYMTVVRLPLINLCDDTNQPSWIKTWNIAHICFRLTSTLDCCKSLYFRIYFIAQFCTWFFLQTPKHAMYYSFLCKSYFFEYFKEMLNSGAFSFAIIKDNKVVMNNWELIIFKTSYKATYLTVSYTSYNKWWTSQHVLVV